MLSLAAAVQRQYGTAARSLIVVFHARLEINIPTVAVMRSIVSYQVRVCISTLLGFFVVIAEVDPLSKAFFNLLPGDSQPPSTSFRDDSVITQVQREKAVYLCVTLRVCPLRPRILKMCK